MVSSLGLVILFRSILDSGSGYYNLPFAWCHVTPHVMAIQLIYRYHVIKSLSGERSDDTNVERLKMIQHIVVGEFLVCMLKVYILADSLLFAN